MESPTLDGLDVPIDVVDIPLFLNSWYFFAEISFVERYSYNDKHLSRLPFKRLLSIKRTRLDQGGCGPIKLKATPGQCGCLLGNLRLIVNIFSSSHFHTADAWATPRAELQGTTSYFPVQL